jgi:hypothetical protein
MGTGRASLIRHDPEKSLTFNFYHPNKKIEHVKK